MLLPERYTKTVIVLEAIVSEYRTAEHIRDTTGLDVSLSYITLILQQLIDAGMVDSKPGLNGGYRRKQGYITAWMLCEAIYGPIIPSDNININKIQGSMVVTLSRFTI